MTDHELADALLEVLSAAPSAYPNTRALLMRQTTPFRAVRPIHEPVPSRLPRAAEIVVPADVEARLLAILDSPPRAGETITAGFTRRERELALVFEAVEPVIAHALHKRLAVQATGDALAARFARMSADRRSRLLAFLGEARRRAAMKGAA